jgi:hypothetical protein
MDIVTGCNRESPLSFRANPQIRGVARRPGRRVTASKHKGIAPSKTMAMRRRRTHAECAVIIALMSTASSALGAAQSPVTTWLRSEWAHPAVGEPTHQLTTGMQNGASCANDLWKLPPTSNVIAAPAAWQKSAPDEAYATEHYGQGRSESGAHGMVLTAMIRPAPLGEITPEPQIPAPTVKPIAPPVAAPPPRAEQPLSPPRQPVAPPPQQEAPQPAPEGPPPPQEAPTPAPERPPGPPPPEETPPPQPPPRGHVRLAP